MISDLNFTDQEDTKFNYAVPNEVVLVQYVGPQVSREEGKIKQKISEGNSEATDY